MEELKEHLLFKKPWGEFERFTLNEISTVKILRVNVNQELSLQYHHNRDEFWQVISGTCNIKISDNITKAKAGDRFFIPKLTLHQIISITDCQILEISFGEFDEKDIVRVKDKYNR